MRRLHEAGTWLLWRSGIAALGREILTGGGRFVLEFHNILAQPEYDAMANASIGLTADELQTILKWVAERFRFLTPDDFLDGNKSGILLTFDDGFVGNVTHALPLLERYEAPAVFFITTQHVQDPHNWLPASRRMAGEIWPDGMNNRDAHAVFDGMSEAQLVTAGQHPLITIGCHTVTHPFLTQCDEAKLQFELEESRRYLKQVSKQSVDLFAYPAGDYDHRVAEAVRTIGYRAAFAESSRFVGIPRYEISRVGLYSSSLPYLNAKFSGLFHPTLRLRYA